MAYSIIIKNGKVFDGTAAPPKQIDIGIDGEKIKKLDNLQDDGAKIVIDASGKYVCPGFIDLTTHSDTHWTLFSQPNQESFIRQGITTILGGHGGSSLAPLVKKEDIEGIQKWVDISKINFNWQSTEEFLSELERRKLPLNFGTLVGHGTIRRGVIGNENRPAEKTELDQMKFLLEKSLKEGAFGISTNLGSAHGKSATDEEVAELLKIVADFNAVASHHLEDEGKNILPALSRLIFLTRSAKVKSHIAHLKAIGKTAWNFFPQVLEMIEQAIREKLRLTCDFFPYTQTGSNLYMLLPEWVREGGKKTIIETVTGEERKNIITALKDLTLHYDRITIASTLHDFESVGKNIAELSKNSGLSPEEIILNLIKLNDLQVTIFNEAISENNIHELARKDYSTISSNGAAYDRNYRSETEIPHPRSFGSFPRIFSWFVKENGILGWEKAIYKMTGLPAKILNIHDRGAIAKGFYADILVFDPETIADRATYANPYQFPDGIECVIINGNIVLKENSLTGKFPGRVLRRS